MSENLPPNTPRPGGDHRALATILFTDVVGFSKLAGQNEERTYAALNRDFAMIRTVVEHYGGQVANTMGDGMLILFQSAVGAMQAAIQIQDNLYRQSLTNPPLGVLEHRMGLHVGDIIIEGSNVFGDGVNIAARLQTVARPGAIAYSKQIRDLVSTHVQLSTERTLATQRLKNITENISVFEIPPIGEALRLKAAEEIFTPASPVENVEATGRRAWLLLAMSIILVGAFVGIMYGLQAGLKSRTETQFGKKGSGSGAKEASEKLEKIKAAMAQQPTAENKPSAMMPPAEPQEAKPAQFMLPPEIFQQIQQLVAQYDFEGAAKLVQAQPHSDLADGVAMIQKYQSLAEFRVWLDREVACATGEKPLSISAAGQTATVFTTSQGCSITIGGVSDVRPLWQWDPKTITAIAMGAAASPPSGAPVPNEAQYWIKLFTDTIKP